MPTVGPGDRQARGYSATTPFVASVDGGNTPIGVVANPFPAGIVEPQGNSLGVLTGVGTDISFSNPDAEPGYVHQFSARLAEGVRRWPGDSVGYMGSRSERLGLGSTSDTSSTSISSIRSSRRSAARCNQSVPNPFGIPEFAGTALGDDTRGQLLRPYPQFATSR